MAFGGHSCSMRIESLLKQASALGLHLEPRGDRLLVTPAENCTAEIVAELRQHKTEVLAALKANSARATWLHIARQILAGEFDDAKPSIRESLTTELWSIPHPLCCRAL